MTYQTHDGDRLYDRTRHLTGTESLELVSAVLRRTALDIVSSSGGPIEPEEPAAKIVVRGGDDELADLGTYELSDLGTYELPGRGTYELPDQGTIGRVASSLHRRHLPRMNTHGIVGYDAAATSVESRP